MSNAELLTGTAGLLAALGTLLTGVAAIILAFRGNKRNSKLPKEEKMKRSRRRRSLVLPFVPGVLLLLVSGAIFTTRTIQGEQEPLNVRLTVAAWNAFNKGDFDNAIASAEKCISEFHGSADREQAKLRNAQALLPPKGKVSDADKKIIFARGLLNDVATCFFIKGRSAESIGQQDVAKQAYEAATKYTHARCWDPQGWFWSPAEAAADRLAGLK